jgi:UDP-GlcNAc:undecaprenyl-phosphate/decaprenyl-phosphate GlcNAc-1-phosphate transferase
MKFYVIISCILMAVMFVYLKLARRWNVVDLPGERSSHSRPTVRGGGIVFLLAALMWYLFLGMQQPWAIAGVLLIGLVSFLDDLYSLPGSLRIVIHLVAAALLFYQLGIFNMHWYLLLAALVLTIGWINAFNFMDGINGITAFYSLVVLGTFSLLNNANRLLMPFFQGDWPVDWEGFLPVRLVGVMFISVVVFAFFNARRRAAAFAGDVGSVSMAFILAWMMIGLMIQTRQVFWILLFAVYGIDTVITILIRIKRKENIFKAHRLHLYQLLANEKGWSHLTVAALYALVQLAINALAIFLIFKGLMSWSVFLFILFILLGCYTFIRYRITQTGIRSA